jgi:rubrerythrin
MSTRKADLAILATALALEQAAAFAYQTAAGSAQLDARTRRFAERFAAHEQAHADALTAALQARGGNPPIAPESSSEISGLDEAALTRRGLLEFIMGMERTALAGYYDAQIKLTDPDLLRTLAQIMANEGQHLAMLRQSAHQDPVPTAFVTGQATQ